MIFTTPLPPETLLIAEAAVLSVPYLVVLWWHARRRRRQEALIAQLEHERSLLANSLACTPDGCFMWRIRDGSDSTPDEVSTLDEDESSSTGSHLLANGDCSRRLAVLLSLLHGRESSFQDVLTSFPASMAERLETAALALRRDGSGFELTLTLYGDDPGPQNGRRRYVRAWGIRATANDGQPLADIIWMRDVTAESAAHTQLSQRTMALEVERGYLRDALNALPSPVWLRDADLRIVFANRAFLTAVEAESLAQVQEEDRELVMGTAARELRAVASAARASGEPRHSPIHVVLGGRRRLLEITETPLSSGSRGSDRTTVGMAQDMTRLETLRSTLEQEATSHAMVLHRLGTAIAIFGGERRLHFHNTAFAKLWHLDSDWLETSPTYGEVLEALRSRRMLPEVADYPAFKDAEMARFKSLLEPVEDLLHLPDGKTLRRVLTPHPLGGLLVTFEDVTDRLALEASLNQVVAVQRETLDHLHEAVAVFGLDSRLRLCNPAFQKLITLADDISAQTPYIADLIEQTPQQAALLEDVRTYLATPPQGRLVRHSRIDVSDGLTLDTLCVPLPDGGVLFTALDMSDSARAEKALRDRADALSEADQQKGRFMANVSYELRTPLTTILGFAEILAEEYYGSLNPRQRDYARSMAETAHQLVTMIDEISDLVSLEAGQMTLTRTTFDIHAALARVLGLTREMVRAKGLTINFDCPPETGAMVADERRIKQVLYNLLTNAIKYTPEGGQIIVSALRQSKEVLFTVADTGIGIAEDRQKDLFDLFQKEGPGKGGAGVGLALVKRFVDLHGGRVELESVKGQGTTVFVHIPDTLPLLAPSS